VQQDAPRKLDPALIEDAQAVAREYDSTVTLEVRRPHLGRAFPRKFRLG
jgi:hypothetical protein